MEFERIDTFGYLTISKPVGRDDFLCFGCLRDTVCVPVARLNIMCRKDVVGEDYVIKGYGNINGIQYFYDYTGKPVQVTLILNEDIGNTRKLKTIYKVIQTSRYYIHGGGEIPRDNLKDIEGLSPKSSRESINKYMRDHKNWKDLMVPKKSIPGLAACSHLCNPHSFKVGPLFIEIDRRDIKKIQFRIGAVSKQPRVTEFYNAEAYEGVCGYILYKFEGPEHLPQLFKISGDKVHLVFSENGERRVTIIDMDYAKLTIKIETKSPAEPEYELPISADVDNLIWKNNLPALLAEFNQ